MQHSNRINEAFEQLAEFLSCRSPGVTWKNGDDPTTAVAPRQSRPQRWDALCDTTLCCARRSCAFSIHRGAVSVMIESRLSRAGGEQSHDHAIGAASPSPDGPALLQTALPSSSAGQTRSVSVPAYAPDWSTTRPAVCSVRGSRISTQRRATGGVPVGYPTAVSVATSTTRPFAIPLCNEQPSPWCPLIHQHRLQRRAAPPVSRDGLWSSAYVGAEDHREPRQDADASSYWHGATSPPCPAAPAPPNCCLPQRPSPGQATNARRAASSATPVPSRADGDGPVAHRSARRDTRLSKRAAPRRGQPRRGGDTREPAQATGFDHMRARGPHGVAVDTLGCDLLAASAFDGVNEAQR